MINGPAGGLIAIGDWHAYSGMQAQMAASNEQAMRASMQAQTVPRDDTEYLLGLMNAYRPSVSMRAQWAMQDEVKRLRRELARPDFWWLGFLGLGALLRWRFW